MLISLLVGPPSRILVVRFGGRCHDRIHRVDRADEFDATHSGFFINSSLAPVLRFRRRFVSVCNVLKGIKVHGFSEARISALWSRWHAVVRMGPTGPIGSPRLSLGPIGSLLTFIFISGLWTL